MSSLACYIVTSFWASGELQLALDFAARQRAAGVEPLFLVPPSHAEATRARGFRYETLVPGSGKLNRMLFEDVARRLHPNVVVLADFLNYTFCERHYGVTVDDLDVFEAPVAAFDLYDFGHTGGRVDTYGFYAANMAEISLERYDRLLQPCPVVPARVAADERTLRYPLFEDLDLFDADAREQARRALDIGADQRVVLVTSALWQATHRPYAAAAPYVQACAEALDELLASLPDDVLVVSVGTEQVGQTRPLSRLRRLESLPAAQFEQLAAACDLYVSNNHISTSMCRLTLKGVPTLLLESSVFKSPAAESVWFARPGRPLPARLDKVPRAYPFRMFPVGWHSFLRTVVADNDFFRIMRHTELFDLDAGAAVAREILDGSDAPRAEAIRRQYCRQLRSLPRAAEVAVA